jgi:hypothetical protein
MISGANFQGPFSWSPILSTDWFVSSLKKKLETGENLRGDLRSSDRKSPFLVPAPVTTGKTDESMP